MTLSELAEHWKGNRLQYRIIMRNIKRKEQSND